MTRRVPYYKMIKVKGVPFPPELDDCLGKIRDEVDMTLQARGLNPCKVLLHFRGQYTWELAFYKTEKESGALPRRGYR